MQEEECAHITSDDLKTENGADGDHKPSDSATSDCVTGVSQTQCESSVCGQKDVQTSDQIAMASESPSTDDLACGEPSSHCLLYTSDAADE